MSSSKDLDLNSDIMLSEHQSDDVVSGARVSDFSASSDVSGAVEEIRASGGDKVMVEQADRVSAGENPDFGSVSGSERGGGFDESEGKVLESEERRDGTEERSGEKEGRGFDVSKNGCSDEEQKSEIEAVRVEHVVKTTETLIEQVKVVGEVEVATEQNEEASNLEGRDEDLSRPGKNHSTRVQEVGGSAQKNVIREANVDICEKFNFMQSEKHETVPQVAETVSERSEGSGRLSLNHVHDNLDEGASLAVDVNSVTEVDNIVIESAVPLENDGRNFEVQPAEAQNMGISVSEPPSCPEEENHTMEPQIEAEEAVVSCKQDENHTMGSHFSNGEASQLNCRESNMGILVVDLDSCFNAGADGDDVGASLGPPLRDSFEKHARDGAIKVHHESHDMNLAPLEPETPLGKECQASYCLATEKEGEFFVSDLVWGKVRSHPWWPGQIFDPSAASEQAMKYHKSDRFLVAYFGDQTFAWNETSSLKPFRTHFSQMEKQSTLEAFRGAIDSALDEVSRRVQLGLSCSCTPEETHAKIKSQLVRNSGIREDVCQRDGMDKSLGITSFEPDKLVGYIKELALYPCGGGDMLELVVAQAQLATFYQSKGYFELPEFHVYGGLFENDTEHATPVIKNEDQASSGQRKMKRRYNSFRRSCEHILEEDDTNPMRKKRSLSELMGGNSSSLGHVNGVKHVAGEKRAGRSASASTRDFNTRSPTPVSSKVRERIRRVASQLTESPAALSCSGEKFPKSAAKVDQSNEELHGVDGSRRSTTGFRRRRACTGIKDSSPDEMLSQLSLSARDPMKGYSFLTAIVDFFTEYRNSITGDDSYSLMSIVSAESGVRNIKPPEFKTKSHGAHNYKSVNECYLSDENIQSSQEEQKSRKNCKRKSSYKLETPTKKDGSLLEAKGFLKSDPSLQSVDRLTEEPENHCQLSSNVDAEQKSPSGNGLLVTEEADGDLDEKDAGDISSTALILNFTEANSIPSEMDLNKIFSRFGALKESETEVLRKSKRAKVVFQSRNDAEVAFSSAGKFRVFGPALVSYQLRYLTSTPSKVSPRATRQSRKNKASS